MTASSFPKLLALITVLVATPHTLEAILLNGQCRVPPPSDVNIDWEDLGFYGNTYRVPLHDETPAILLTSIFDKCWNFRKAQPGNSGQFVFKSVGSNKCPEIVGNIRWIGPDYEVEYHIVGLPTVPAPECPTEWFKHRLSIWASGKKIFYWYCRNVTTTTYDEGVLIISHYEENITDIYRAGFNYSEITQDQIIENKLVKNCRTEGVCPVYKCSPPTRSISGAVINTALGLTAVGFVWFAHCGLKRLLRNKVGLVKE